MRAKAVKKGYAVLWKERRKGFKKATRPSWMNFKTKAEATSFLKLVKKDKDTAYVRIKNIKRKRRL